MQIPGGIEQYLKNSKTTIKNGGIGSLKAQVQLHHQQTMGHQNYNSGAALNQSPSQSYFKGDLIGPLNITSGDRSLSNVGQPLPGKKMNGLPNFTKNIP